ncbi:Transposase family Tnp2 protein [Ceratobasidium sp. AG-Ba]|nr:Transposase family Tnp2 protein [Ceratobasidium sp. AG-Ba]
MQKPRTIDDHRTRYPNQEPAQPYARGSDAPAAPTQGGSEVTEEPLVDTVRSPIDQDQNTTVDYDMVSDDLTGPADESRHNLEYLSPPPIERHHLEVPPLEPGLDDLDELLHAAPEVDREYPFDQLIQNFDSEPRLFDHAFAWLNYAGDNLEENEQPELLDDLYDEDFGLPDHDGQLPNHDVELYQFRLEEELDGELELDHDALDNHDSEMYCAAFEEPDVIRNAYIDAFIQKSLYGATHRAIRHQLRASRRTLAGHPDVHPEHLAKMAQTIGTVEKRLGVNHDSLITTFTLCPSCGRRYTQDYIGGTDDAQCLNEGCMGTLFTVRKLASGAQRRISSTTYPFASPIAWIRHMLCLPGMAEIMQTWRTEAGDSDGLKAPVPSEYWMQHTNPNKPIGDMCDAWGWRSIEAGLERYADPRTGNIVDKSTLDPPVRFVSLPFGISLSLNTDWFQATKEGNYSVGACYLAINNLPRHMRFLRENISLCLLMPGPNEPNAYALDQMLGPLIDELIELKQGVRMIVRKGDPPVYQEEVVHGDLTQHIADLMARIKMGGGAGLKSELNFCLYCRMRLSHLSVSAGYMRQNFAFRDPQEERNNVYHWKSLPTAEERKADFDRTGNRFTALHSIAGWHTSTSSPPDAMHLLYLGAMNWIVKQVLVGPGMLATRRLGDTDPQVLFNKCLDDMWMPRNFQRLPPKLGQTRGSIKADQWKLASRILYIPLFIAFRDGDEIGNGYVSRGGRSSSGAKHQAHRAKLLHQQRLKYFQSIGQPDQCPRVQDCYSSRSLRFHYQQVLRFCLAVNTIDKRTVTPGEIGFAQQLLETLCIDYVQNNVQLPPNFHYLMHLEEFLLKYGSVYNTHVWGMERANGIINGLRALPNRTPTDDEMIRELTEALRGGTEQAQQRGTLMAFIAQCQTAYTRLYGLQTTSPSQSPLETGAFDVLLARRAEDYTPKTKRLDTLHRAVVDASTLDYIYEQPQEAATHQAKIRRRRRRIQNRK